MAKQVHNSAMVAHLWANRSQDSARTSNGNLFFRGDTIYSYGSHFPIARWVSHKGRSFVLFTSQRYSVTTSAHCSEVRNAIPPGVKVFTVESVCGKGHKDNVAGYRFRILQDAKTAKRSRLYGEEYAARLRELVSEANEYAELFCLKTRFAVPSESEPAAVEAKGREAAKRDKARREAVARKRRQELAELAAEWIRGERDTMPNDYPEILLRVKGSRLQTSRGAVVELDSAKKLLPLVRSGRDWHRNGETIRVGDFELDAIDTAGNVQIGCHAIKRSEIERVAAALGI